MAKKSIYSKGLYLLPCSIWKDTWKDFKEIEKKEFESKIEKIRELKFNRGSVGQTKKSQVKDHLIELEDFSDEIIQNDDYVLTIERYDIIDGFLQHIAFVTDDDKMINSIYEEKHIDELTHKLENKFRKKDFIECLNYQKIIRLGFKPGKEKYGLILFGDYLWSISENDLVLTENERMLLMMEQIDKERKKFEQLRAKFSGSNKSSIDEPQRTKIPEDVRIYVWRRDQGKCVKCGHRQNLEYDHIIPVSKGGSNTARNIELLCQDCNRKKSDEIM